MADAPGNIRNKLVDMSVVWQTGFHMKTVVCKLLCFNEKKKHILPYQPLELLFY
jgi:hypothetical protein